MGEQDLKIAILCPGYGRVVRGVETFTEELSRRLVESRPAWQIDIYCRGRGSVSQGIRQIHVPAVDRDSRIATLYAQIGNRLGIFLRTRIDAECLSFALALAPRILATRYDVIFNQAGPFAGRLLQIKRRLDGTPFVHKTASGYGDLELMMAKQRPDAIIATSPFAREWLESAHAGLNIECIPNAVDRHRFRPLSAQELRASRNGHALLDMSRPIVLFVGAMDPMKRPELLISAVSRIPEAGLVMVGSGRLSDQIAEMGSRRLGARFLHIPEVSRDELGLYYNACDIFTLPSEEPFGIAFLEAMACNKPVLGHDSPVQQWMFGDAGETCDCTDTDAYADAIKRVLGKDFGDNPVERSKSFDWSEVVPRYEALFLRVARRS